MAQTRSRKAAAKTADQAPPAKADVHEAGAPVKAESPKKAAKVESDGKPVQWVPKEGATGLIPGREVVGPLILTALPPAFIITLWYIIQVCKGDLFQFAAEISSKGAIAFYQEIWPSPWNPVAWKIIFSYMAVQLFLMRAVPGKRFTATATATGHVPVYNANGMQVYLINLFGFFALYHYGIIKPGLVYDHFGELLASMNVFSLGFVFLLYVKGLNFPSTRDSGSNGNFVIDYYWGTELYPRILGWDVKMFTNCRFGMMFWQIGLLCYAVKQFETIGHVSSSMLVCVALQTIYIAKFFWWETGYLCSMDIQHDRAGFYICWGCLVYLPCLYTSQGLFLVEHPVDLSPAVAGAIFAAGVFSIWLNYDADRQRQHFRLTNGKCTIWGREPSFISARYTTKRPDGTDEERSSLLLTSGWWGLSRHFHYIPEIMASFFWSAPALFSHAIPYLYVTYLTILLVDRAWRDDKRCGVKYGAFWAEYRRRVPYFIIPGIV